MRGTWAVRSLAVVIYGATGVLARPPCLSRAGTPGAPSEAALIDCRLCAAIFTSSEDRPRVNLSCLAESAANLRTSWVSSARRELASKLHLKQRSVSPLWRQYATLFGSDGSSFVGSSSFCATAHSSPRLQLLRLW